MATSLHGHHGMNVATVIELAAYGLFAAMSFRSLGLHMFQNLSREGQHFWALQAILLAALTAASIPLRHGGRTRLAPLRFIIAVILLLSFCFAAALSDGFQH